MTFKISARKATDAQELNRAAEQCPYDVWLQGVSGTADAKSLLGMMLLTLEDGVKLVDNSYILVVDHSVPERSEYRDRDGKHCSCSGSTGTGGRRRGQRF